MPQSTRHVQKFASALIVLSLVSMMFATPVAATTGVLLQQGEVLEEDGANFLCDGEGSAQPGADNAVGLIQNGVAVLLVLAPVAGIGIALYATFMGTVKNESGEWNKYRRNALIGGFGIVLLAYVLQAAAGPLLGYDVGCIIP